MPPRINLPLLDISCQWNQTIHGLLLLKTFTFQVHSCCGFYQHFHSFLWTNTYSAARTYSIHTIQILYRWICFVYLFIIDEHLDIFIFWPLGIVLLWTFVTNSCVELCFQFYGYVPQSRILRSRGKNLCFPFLGNAKFCPFANLSTPFWIPTSNMWAFQFLHILAKTYYLTFWF